MEYKEKYNFGGWPNCIRISNGDIDLVSTTDVGPRIMRFGFVEEQNLLLEIGEELGKIGGDNYRLYGGSRLWHSPEASPRSYYPDNIKVDHNWDGKCLKLMQPVETTTGMQKEINLIPSDSGASIEVIYRIYNKNLWPIKYALWALTLMAKNGRVIIPQEPSQKWEENLQPVRPLVLWAYTAMDDPRWIWGKKYIQLRQDPKSDNPQKVGLLNKLGWQAYYLNGHAFIKRYSFDSMAEYPDFQCNTQVYSDPNLFEFETLGPLKVIEPGDYSEYKENWYLFKVKLEENEDSIDKNLLPLIEKTEIPK
ncbi:MAG: DUF4380 domain-containing protein [Actinobacteria bacterium]|nr:DUF4380 domain-containing protein [Actinomycetota bacterium]